MSARRIAGIVAVLVVALPLAVLLQLAVASDLSLVAGAPDLVLIVRLRPGAGARARARLPGGLRGGARPSTCWPSTRSAATR